METTFRKYYHGKRILVTGDTGFKGSWLSMWLRELGAEVTGFSLEPPSEPNHFTVSRLGAKITHVSGDVRDYGQIAHVLEKYRPEIVFHLAAQALVRYSYEQPRLTMESNVLGTANICEAVRLAPSVRSLIVVTSDKCYENREQVWGYKEADPLGGDDPYSASKSAAELVFRGYWKSFFRHADGFGAVSVRAGNVIGGGDWGKDRIVPDAVRSLSRGEPVRVRHPEAVRPWLHVLEPLSGYLWLGARLAEDPKSFSGNWNFGPGDRPEKRVGDLVESVAREWGAGSWIDASEENNDQLHETTHLRLSSDKAKTRLPWSAMLTMEETIRMAAKWYKFFHDYPDTDMYQYGVHQIREYSELALQRGESWAA